MKTILRLDDFFAWGHALNDKRGWDLIPISMAFVHFSEELGELAEVIVDFKSGNLTESTAKNQVAGEAADTMILLIKLAQICGVDLLAALKKKGIVNFLLRPAPTQNICFADYIEPHTMRLLKSLGELARHVNFEEKFKDPQKRTGTQRPLVDELTGMFELLMKVFVVCQVDTPKILRFKMDKIAKRFEPEASLMETLSYLRHAADVSAAALKQYQKRFC